MLAFFGVLVVTATPIKSIIPRLKALFSREEPDPGLATGRYGGLRQPSDEEEAHEDPAAGQGADIGGYVGDEAFMTAIEREEERSEERRVGEEWEAGGE